MNTELVKLNLFDLPILYREVQKWYDEEDIQPEDYTLSEALWCMFAGTEYNAIITATVGSTARNEEMSDELWDALIDEQWVSEARMHLEEIQANALQRWKN